MAGKKIDQFPDVRDKLHAPSKKSVFERQKAEAEAKRLREEAETKAVYEDFVKSFDDEDDGFGNRTESVRPSRGGFGGGGGGQPQRHYTGGPGGFNGGGRGSGSGPGSLGPAPSAIGRGNKRTYESFQQPRRDDRALLAFEDYEGHAPAKAFRTDDDDDDDNGNARSRGAEEEKAAAKPTLKLDSLPPGTSPAVIKALLPATLTVDAVRLQAPAGPGAHSERKSMSAIVTLAKDTPANDIDTAVNALQNRYLGYGYYLNLHRHLSSAAISASTSTPALGGSTTSQPFGAKPVNLAPAGRGHAPPPHRGGFAPPTSYAPTGANQLNRGGPLLHVPVQPPQNIKELKLIHKVIESLLQHGPEFEALLMTRPDVQREERWAWLWDSRSAGGVWYRWRIWEILTGSQTRRGQGKYLPLFEGSSAWKAPDQPLAYEYSTRLDEFISDSEYNSSDEDDSGDEGPKRHHHGGAAPTDGTPVVDDGKAYLNPLEKAKLTHLLARLPTSTGKLRKGDIARCTAFAILHAGRGADEVVEAILSNIEKPFSHTSANPETKKDKNASAEDTAAAGGDDEEKSDTSSASLIGVYIISDILSSSSTSGVRHAWRYRQLFETALKQRQIFEELGRMERKMNWGRLRAEKWKRSVGNILSLWEGWCVFPQESQEHFVNVFNSPPLTEKEAEEAKEKNAAVAAEKGKSRWKAVEVAPKPVEQVVETQDEQVDGEPMADDDDEDVDGEPMDEDEDLDGVPMEEDESVDGEPMEEDRPDAELEPEPEPVMDTVPEEKEKAVSTAARSDPSVPGPGPQHRRRPRAVDMFADSDEDEA